MRVGEASWPPLRGRFDRGEIRELKGNSRIYFAEKRMPWGRLKFR